MRKMNPPTNSREAAQECSPQRKLWVAGESDTQAPKGRNKPASLPVLFVRNPHFGSVSIDSVQSTLTPPHETMILIAPKDSHEKSALRRP